MSTNLYRECKMISNLDGSIIDLKRRDHLHSHSPPAHPTFLRKRRHNGFLHQAGQAQNQIRRAQSSTRRDSHPEYSFARPRKRVKNSPYQNKGNAQKDKMHLKIVANSGFEKQLHAQTRDLLENWTPSQNLEPQIVRRQRRNNISQDLKYRESYNTLKSSNGPTDTKQDYSLAGRGSLSWKSRDRATPRHPGLATDLDFNPRSESIQTRKINPYAETYPDHDPRRQTLNGQMKNLMQVIIQLHQGRKDPVKVQRQVVLLKSLLNHVDIEDSNLCDLKQLLRKFLTNQPVRRKDINLSNIEILLFVVYLIKKKFQRITHLRWNCSYLNELREAYPKKRSEQNYKVILKRFFKKVISDFNRIKGLPQKSENEFYQFYFAKAARSLNYDFNQLKFQHVFNETKVARSKNQTPRHSKRIFARVLNKCPDFMRMMEDYMNNNLKLNNKTHGIYKDYSAILDKKLTMLLFKWRQALNTETDLRVELADFIVNKLLNDKVKLPWAYQELHQGILNVRDLFNKK